MMSWEQILELLVKTLPAGFMITEEVIAVLKEIAQAINSNGPIHDNPAAVKLLKRIGISV